VINKFCLVKLKYSSAFRRFARGQFYLGEIDDLAKKLTTSEGHYINQLLAMQVDTAVKAYTLLLNEMYDVNCAIPGRVERFKDLHTITRHISVTDREDYLVFPSGSKDPSETDISSAIREMTEETGIAKIYGISENPILYSYTSWDNINYTVNYWISIVDAPRTSPRNKEVDGTVWVDEIPEEYDAVSILEILKKSIKTY
jgi:8-oxo-dGTP pyrophosphatase MutT (NUDIX family)